MMIEDENNYFADFNKKQHTLIYYKTLNVKERIYILTTHYIEMALYYIADKYDRFKDNTDLIINTDKLKYIQTMRYGALQREFVTVFVFSNMDYVNTGNVTFDEHSEQKKLDYISSIKPVLNSFRYDYGY